MTKVYANSMEVPAHLSTVEFFREVESVLTEDGWLCVNAAGFGFEDPVVVALARTVAAAWGQDVLLVRVPFSRNCVLFARRADARGRRGYASGTGRTSFDGSPGSFGGPTGYASPRQERAPDRFRRR